MPGEVDDKTAQDMVFDNLGLDKAELEQQTNQNDPADENDNDESDQQQQDNQQQNDKDDQAGNEDGEQPPQLNNLRPKDNKQQQQLPRDSHRPFPKNAPVKPDKQGNLRDAQGNIVARAGKEARLYTQAHRERTNAQRATEERNDAVQRLNRAVEIGQELYAENEKYKQTQQQLQQLGLQPQELAEAAQAFVEYKRDPLSVLKKLLTRAAADGKDLSTLGMQPGSVDPKSLMDMIRETIAQQVKPVQDRTAREEAAEQARQRQEAAQADAAKEVQQFFKNNPDAIEYAPAIEKLLAHPSTEGMSLNEIWLRIQLNIARRGSSQNRQMPSLPNGRNGNGGNSRRGPEIAPINASYDDIVKSVLV